MECRADFLVKKALDETQSCMHTYRFYKVSI